MLWRLEFENRFRTATDEVAELRDRQSAHGDRRSEGRNLIGGGQCEPRLVHQIFGRAVLRGQAKPVAFPPFGKRHVDMVGPAEATPAATNPGDVQPRIRAAPRRI